MNKFNRNRPGRESFGKRDFRGREDRQMFDAVCSNCGKKCQVPFMPSGSKPVYCSSCFEHNTDSRGGSRFENRGFGRSNYDDNRGRDGGRDRNFTPKPDSRQLDAISEKLDKIISLLTPTPTLEVETKKGYPKDKKVKSTKKKTVSKKKKA